MEVQDLVDHLDSLLGYALFLTRHQSDAEDLVQETYVRAIQKMEDVRNPDSTKAWMFTILRNFWTSQQRHLSKMHIETEIDLSSIRDLGSDKATDALSCYESNLERGLVQKALQQLPSEAREILILREFEELPYRTIADILDCPLGTVMSRLARARIKLRDLLSDTQQGSATTFG